MRRERFRGLGFDGAYLIAFFVRRFSFQKRPSCSKTCSTEKSSTVAKSISVPILSRVPFFKAVPCVPCLKILKAERRMAQSRRIVLSRQTNNRICFARVLHLIEVSHGTREPRHRAMCDKGNMAFKSISPSDYFTVPLRAEALLNSYIISHPP